MPIISRKQNLRRFKKARKSLKLSEKRSLAIAKSILNYKSYSRFQRMLGPGIVTGAADDDPSGIITYSQTGAVYGYSLLWTALFMYPMLLYVQEACSRIGAVTGKGLAAVLRDNYSRKLLYFAVSLVLFANVINIGADISAIASTTRLFIPVSVSILAVIYAIVILLLEIFVSYKKYAKILKWLTLSLLAYIFTALMVSEPWGKLLYSTVHINIHIDFAMLYILVGLLGTTISPYLFFWDTSEVVEDEIMQHRLAENTQKEPRLSRRFLRSVHLDNFVGMTFSEIATWFMIVTCATVLHFNGVTQINTLADAAKALEPLVRSFPDSGLVAKIIFSAGVLGLGFLAIPVLAGSASYAISEVFGWREGLHRRLKRAVGFYMIIVVSTLAGLAINFLGINPIKALIFAAVFNGLAAVPLLFMIARVGNNANIMGQYKNKFVSNLVIRLTFVVMLVAGLVLIYSFIKGA
ncbi:MAG TPA: Nramp family divalent metal transporter [Patescibacteria group bacterium]|nr:Nramp family divalent metal transporter [Patescibacteria group bacterium]